jgi:glycosyltransferase involved in cell wall biosynthesis
MKVAHILDHFLPRNLGTIYDTLTGLEQFGIEQLVLCLKRDNENLFPMQKVYPFHSLDHLRRNLFRACATLQRTSYALPYFSSLIDKENPVLLHSHFLWMGSDCLKLKQRFHLPMVLSLYGEDDIKLEQPLMRKEIIRNILRGSDYVICHSKYIEECAKRFVESRTRVIDHGVDLQLFMPAGNKKNGDRFTVGTAARLDAVKGIETLLYAFKYISAKHPNVVLQIAGSGWLLNRLQTTVAALGVSKQVEFVGWVPRKEMPAFYQNLDVFVLPSIILPNGITEAAGMVLIEAQACGVPVVASKVGGIPEILMDGRTGKLVPPSDPESLGSAVSALLDDVDIRRDMGINARAMAEMKFDIKKQNAALAEIYKESGQ